MHVQWIFRKKDKGIVIRYLLKMTEYPRQQLTRLIKQYTKTGKLNWIPCCSKGFTIKYTDQDKVKSVYHINAVDEVTQFEIVCSVEKSVPNIEQYLKLEISLEILNEYALKMSNNKTTERL